MKILFLEQYSKISGGQLCLLDLLEHLDRKKFSAIVGVPEQGELTTRLSDLEIETLILPVGNYTQGKKTVFDIIKVLVRTLILVPRLISIIREQRIDLVYVNAPRAFLWGTLAARLAKVPVIWHVHLILKGNKEKLLARWLLRLGVDHVICVSRAVAESFITEKFKPKNLSIVYNGTDLEQINPAVDRGIFRDEYRLQPEEIAIGVIGQLSPAKGQEVFLRAASLILHKFPQAKFFIVGGSSYSPDGQQYIDRLQGLTEELGLGESVVFTGQRQDIPKVIAGLDIIVVPSLVPEAFSRVIIEAMAGGRVVVASNNGAPPELVRHGEDGFLFDSRQEEQLAQTVEAILNDRQLRAEVESKARAKAVKQFGISHYISKISEILGGISI
ncbi:MAG TPA: glycosyltransferase [Bacillota bacterium]|nr:glycosyltransferase [Bacillota bacterium]